MKDQSKRLARMGIITGTVIAVIALAFLIVTLLIAQPAAEGVEGTAASSVETEAGDTTASPAQEVAACDYPSEWVGKPADEAAIKKFAKAYRILPPGSMATMDYSPDRLNVETDDKNVVVRVTCG